MQTPLKTCDFVLIFLSNLHCWEIHPPIIINWSVVGILPALLTPRGQGERCDLSDKLLELWSFMSKMQFIMEGWKIKYRIYPLIPIKSETKGREQRGGMTDRLTGYRSELSSLFLKNVYSLLAA